MNWMNEQVLGEYGRLATGLERVPVECFVKLLAEYVRAEPNPSNSALYSRLVDTSEPKLAALKKVLVGLRESAGGNIVEGLITQITTRVSEFALSRIQQEEKQSRLLESILPTNEGFIFTWLFVLIQIIIAVVPLIPNTWSVTSEGATFGHCLQYQLFFWSDRLPIIDTLLIFRFKSGSDVGQLKSSC